MRLKQAADELRAHLRETKGKMPDAYGWLLANDLLYVLRRRGVEREHRLAHDESGRKLRDHHLPHIPIDANVYARTWKSFNILKKSLGRTTTSEVLEHDILPMIENVVRKTKEVK